MYPQPIERLVNELAKLPGIGRRTAQRLAFHILRASDDDAIGLADAIREVREKVGLCEVCFNLAEGPRCEVCDDTRRDATLICVVEQPADVIPIERTHEYRGLYHVLGGALSPIDGVDPEDLKIAELVTPGRRRRGAGARGRPGDQPDDHRRGHGPLRRRAAARAGSRSPASRPACPSAPTSSTRTRSPSAARSPAGSRSTAERGRAQYE